MARERATGRFVSVEGIEGSGKSTLVAGLAARLREGGVDPLVTREPGGTPLGESVRRIFLEPGADVDPLAEAFLLNAARAQLVRTTIAPALEAGRWVLSDRFSTSTLAYQGYGRGVDLDTLRTLIGEATGGLEPDVILLVDVRPELSRERTDRRNSGNASDADRLERESSAFHARVRDGYLTLARSDPRIRVLDGTLPPAELLLEACAELRIA